MYTDTLCHRARPTHTDSNPPAEKWLYYTQPKSHCSSDRLCIVMDSLTNRVGSIRNPSRVHFSPPNSRCVHKHFSSSRRAQTSFCSNSHVAADATVFPYSIFRAARVAYALSETETGLRARGALCPIRITSRRTRLSAHTNVGTEVSRLSGLSEGCELPFVFLVKSFQKKGHGLQLAEDQRGSKE